MEAKQMETKTGRKADYVPLAKDILAVAVQGGLGTDWAAYVGIVPGVNHDDEWERITRTGAKLRHRVAAVLFPHFELEYIWRR